MTGNTYNQYVPGNYNAIAQGPGASAHMHKYVTLGPRPVIDLGAAQAGLAEMPTDRVLPPGTLPPGSSVPLGANRFFGGRDAELLRLAELLKAGGSDGSPLVVALSGIGGVGKSQLAVEVARRCGPYLAGGVYWISLADPNAVSASVATACAGMSDLPSGVGDLDLPTQVQMIGQAWASDLPRLLVFDNCEDEAVLEQWRPKSGAARVLVTTRRSTFDPLLGAVTIVLDALARPDAETLIERLLGAHANASAALASEAKASGVLGAIAAELGDLPLALHLAGSFLGAYARVVTPAAYLAELRSPALLQHPSLVQASGRSPTEHDPHVARTFALSYERLDQENPVDALALQLLARAACFAPGVPIPRWLLTATLNGAEEDTNSQYRVEDAYQKLEKVGLLSINFSGDSSLHKLVAINTKCSGASKEDQREVEQATIRKAHPLVEYGDPRRLQAWLAHLQYVTDQALVRADGAAATLAGYLGGHFQTMGDFTAAQRYLEHDLAVTRKLLGMHDSRTATCLNNLGLLHYKAGNFDAARIYLLRSLGILRKTLGDNHPYTARTLNNLGEVMVNLGDWPAGRSYLERALAIQRKVLGEEYPDIASTLNNLGSVLHDMGDLKKARKYLARAMVIFNKEHGEQHPDSAACLNNIGLVLIDMGQFTAARTYLARALAVRRVIFGEQHPDTAVSYHNLGTLYFRQGEVATARRYFEQALAISSAVLGLNHPDTNKTQTWLDHC